MFRLVTIVSSEISAIAFAVYLSFFLFQSPGYMPPPEDVMRDSFSFCGICAGYWWFQSGSLALSGASSAIRVATDLLASLSPSSSQAMRSSISGGDYCLYPISNNTAPILQSPFCSWMLRLTA
jgi:hypothetical protein